MIAKICRPLLFASLFLLTLTGLSFESSAAQSPLEVVRSGVNRVMELVRPCKPGESVGLRGERGKIESIVDEYVDFREMAMRTLGLHWKRQSPEKREEFVRLFEDLLFNTYMDRVDTYTCGGEKVAYDTQQVEGKYASVTTRIVGYRDADVVVSYRLKLKDGQWKVYDVIVEGVSLVNNYRSQFSSILSRQSFDSLLNRMREKIASR